MKMDALIRRTSSSSSPVQPWRDPICPSLCTCKGARQKVSQVRQVRQQSREQLRSHLHVGVLLLLHARHSVDHRVGVIQLVWKQQSLKVTDRRN